ncbi:MAG: sensor histidine kinase [Limisphaerales bacterium]
MALLVAVGVYSLRQDKALAEAEAKERAQSYADDLERHISSVLSGRVANAFADVSIRNDITPMFLISTNGALIYPRSETAPNAIDIPTEALNTEQRRLWEAAISAEFGTNHTTAVNAYRQFLKSDPPYHHDVRARYSLAILLGHSDEAEQLLTTVKKTTAVSETGLPMALLAKIKLTELAFNSTNLSRDKQISALIRLCEEAVEHRTILTGAILELAQHLAPKISNIKQLTRRIDNERLAEELYDTSRRAFVGDARPVIVDLDEPYLLLPQPQGAEVRVACYTLFDIKQDVDGILSSAASSPEYFGFTVEFGGRELTSLNAKPWRERSYFSPRSPGMVLKKEYLATTNGVARVLANARGSGATETLSVNVLLTNREALFKRQQARRNWFGTLIFISAVVAGSGLWRSWRTFHRQQQLNEMKSNFVSSVSHELRAPIASVRLLAEALDRGAVSEQPKQKEYFRFIVQECRRLTGLIENVLDFSRIEQGRKNYLFEETDLNALVEQTVKLMQPAAAERGVQLEISQPSTTNQQLTCDGLAVQQALVNLIDNAIKHSPPGESIEVELNEVRRLNSEMRNSIAVSVTDHGAGIPAEDHDKIFERFYRRGSELRRETQGIGIGLTIVKHVAEAHGGRVLVESTVGKGSKFTIELPLNQIETK